VLNDVLKGSIRDNRFMCLLVVAYKYHTRYPLILLANRDEYYDRPTASAHFWAQAPELLAGKDLQAGGTWLGITKTGKIAAITNYRDPKSIKHNAPSRGSLVTDFLMGDLGPLEYLKSLEAKAERYNGFNIIVGTTQEIYWYSNRGPGIVRLTRGIHGLSNHLLDTPWPKVLRAKQGLSQLLSSDGLPPDEAFLELLMDSTQADETQLPNTGIGLEWERILSPIFVSSAVYGTRSSTLIFVDINGKTRFIERTHHTGSPSKITRSYEFQLRLGNTTSP